MPAVHIRNLDDSVIEALKRRAAQSHRSLEAELRVILEAAASEEGGKPRRRTRRLRLRTVSIGALAGYGRDEIYGDEDR
jgi:plasmid stability protein